MESFVTQTNVKALAVSAIVLLFTYWYYAGKELSFLSLGAMIAFWGLAAAAWVTGALIFKGMGYLLASGGAYPHLLFRFIFPLLTLLLGFWLIYGIATLPAFNGMQEYVALLKGFCRKHLPYIAIVSLIVAIALSFPAPPKAASSALGHPGYIKLAVSLTLALLASLLIIYPVKRINQPALAAEYAATLHLGAPLITAGHEVRPLLNAGPDQLAGEPYLVTGTGDVIINILYRSSNKQQPLKQCYRIGKAGEVTDSLITDELFPKNDIWVFDSGVIRALQSKQMINWVFDQRRTVAETKTAIPQNDPKVVPVAPDTASLKTEYFYKTTRVPCEAPPDVQWNGTRYYAIVHRGETIRFKVDNVYAYENNGRDCRERTVEYFTAPALDYALIRLDQRTYYVIRPLKK